MIDKKTFLEKFKISGAEFKKSEITWKELTAIYNDFETQRTALEITAKAITDTLISAKIAHSVRWRVKDSLHLLEKIIRKRNENSKRIIDKSNYQKEITDLVGIRVLHLFKSDWESIHDFIEKKWTPNEATANIREGDDTALFEKKKCTIKKHEFGYRSVHYIVESSASNQTHLAEVQVRTIFEEAWSEIDHDIRYHDEEKNPLLSQFLDIFNRLAGSADEMGTFIKALQDQINTFKKEISDKNNKVFELKKKIKALELDTNTTQDLNNDLDNLNRRNNNLFHPSISNIQTLINHGLNSQDLSNMVITPFALATILKK